jgi:diguanylate cyclase (GGDEF)-like protein
MNVQVPWRLLWTGDRPSVRLFSLTALAVSLALAGLSVGMAVSGHDARRSALDRSLASEADAHAEAIDAALQRARTIALITAHTAAFVNFYHQSGHGGLAKREQVLVEAADALGYVGTLFPSSIRELSFIDRRGAENARVVDGVSAPRDQLSHDQRSLPYFRPALALAPGHVLQSTPYLSPVTHDWVIVNATPIPFGGEASPAIVHFDLTLESFRQLVRPDAAGYQLRVIDGRTGKVIIDGAQPQIPGAQLGSPTEPMFAALTKRAGSGGTVAINGYPNAYRTVAAIDANANRWIVVASSDAPTVGLFGDLRVVPVLLAGVATLLMLFALVILRVSRRELQVAATSDPLTGLGNRRMLMLDLDRRLARAQANPMAVILFDLNGFKAYNDTFGHLAGDALLARLSRALGAAVAPHGAYRMGGDEFCVLADQASRAEVELAAIDALSERGDGFDITSSFGVVLVPAEATHPTQALRIADKRMYAHKAGGRVTPGRQSSAVLLQALSERHPGIKDHLGGVATLTAELARHLGLSGDQLNTVLQTAELHDIGKVAIPDAILNKPGPLDDDERTFMRRHTLIGERILGASAALEPVGLLVRSTHEAWDGSGYPDALAGEDIPLAARMVAVCDAFDAIVSDRAYRSGRTTEQALAELHRCAGTQFDPSVVAAFTSMVAERDPTATSQPPSLATSASSRDGS